MKFVYATLSTALTIALTSPSIAQTGHDTAKTDMGKHEMSGMMGTPTFDATVDGLRLRGWIVTQQEHRAMMNDHDASGDTNKRMEDPPMMRDTTMTRDTTMGMDNSKKGMDHESMSMGMDMKDMKHDQKAMDQATKNAMTAGTHHIMVDVTDVATGKNTANASGRVLIVSPSMKNSSVELKSVMSHFGDGLTLDEKGEYQFTLYIKVKGVSKTTQFTYDVR